MKIYILILGLFWLQVSCTKLEPQVQWEDLSGYWEIEKVVLPDGEARNYVINETIDFYQWDKDQGVRKKVKPQLDGHFLTNEVAEIFYRKDSINKVFLQFKNPYETRYEEVVHIKDSVLILQNAAQIQYHFKRFIPFNLP
jgi:hypothetical protein